MLGLVGMWSHWLAACLYGVLAVWQLRHWNGDARNRPLVAAFAVMACWSMFVASFGPYHLLSGLSESARNFAYLSFMYGIVRSAGDVQRQRAVRLVYTSVAGVIGLQIVVAGVIPRFEDNAVVLSALLTTAHVLGLTIAAGSLVLVHNLYGQAAPDSRWGIRLPVIALAGMWAYDLHLYTVAYLTRDPVSDLFAMRGAVAAMLVPLFAVASRRNANWNLQLSRAATFQSISVLGILAYLILMMSATEALEVIGGEWVRIGQIGLVFAMTVAALIFLPSGRARAWLSVVLAKHFFEHRYDYREEWLRFTRTIGMGGGDAAPLAERIVKALADVAGSPAGLLLLADPQRPPHTCCPLELAPALAAGRSRRSRSRSFPGKGSACDRIRCDPGRPARPQRRRLSRSRLDGGRRADLGRHSAPPFGSSGWHGGAGTSLCSAPARLGGSRPVPHRRYSGRQLPCRSAQPGSARQCPAVRRVQPPLRLHHA
jgi:putative PEP-CTERM system histidine kinase